MSRDFAQFASVGVGSLVLSRASTCDQVYSRHHPNRTENPRVGGSIPSLTTVWDDNLGGFEPPGAKACLWTCLVSSLFPSERRPRQVLPPSHQRRARL